MNFHDPGQSSPAVDELIDRAMRSQEALTSVAAQRKDGLARLTAHVRDLTANNGDLADRIEELEAQIVRIGQERAEEARQAAARIAQLEQDVAQGRHDLVAAQNAAAEREAELNAENERVTDLYGRVAREFQRFVSTVDRQTVAVAEEADEAERNLVALDARNRLRAAAAPSPAPVPEVVAVQPAAPAAAQLPPASNLVRMPLPPRRASDVDPVVDDVDFDRVREGFGGMLKGRA